MDETYSCYCQILELETGIRDLETRGVNWVFIKCCIFLEGYKKTKKPKILDSSGLAFAKTLKSFFLVRPQEMATFSTKSLHFPGGVPKKPPKKTKILDSSGLLHQDSNFFCFLGTSSGNGNVFHQKIAFSWQKQQKKQRFWTLQASPSPRL